MFTDEEKAREIIRQLQVSARPYVKPLSWCTDLTDAQSIKHIASCFALRIGDELFGVTAAHVIEEYLKDLDDNDEVHLCIMDRPINLEIIENGKHLGVVIDIATFRLEAQTLEELGWKELSYSTTNWPPPAPVAPCGLVLCGYPKDRQEIENNRSVIFEQVANRLVVERVEERNIAIEVRAKFLQPPCGGPIPDLKMDVGGYSGAPLLIETQSPGSLFEFGGVIYEGQLREAEDNSSYVDLRAEPARRINSDGHLNTGVI